MSGRIDRHDGARFRAAVSSGREIHRTALAWLIVITLTIGISQSSLIGSLSVSALGQLVATATALFQGDALSAMPAPADGQLSAAIGQVSSAEAPATPIRNASAAAAPAGGGAPAASGPALVVSPRAGGIGSRFDVSGTGFPTGSAVMLTWDGASFATTMPSSKGALQATVVVPTTYIGTHALAALVLGTAIASTQFTVVAGLTSPAGVAQPTAQPPAATASAPATVAPTIAPTSVPTAAPAATAAPTAAPIVAPPAGKAYYLSPSGNDGNPGTAAGPWRTFCKANSMVAAGDTVHVLPGTYREEPRVPGLCDPGGSFLAGIYLGRGGTAAARVTYISDTRWGALVRSSGRGIAVRIGGPYIDFIGFDVSIGSGELSEPNGTLHTGIFASGSGVRVVGNRVHDLPLDLGCRKFGGAGIVLGYSPVSAAASTTGQVADGNWVNNTGTASSCSPSGAVVHGIYGQTIRMNIRNNVLYHNVGGYGLVLNGCYTAAEISNNLFFDNGSSAIGLFADLEQGCSRNAGTRVNNNIIRDENQHSRAYGVIRDQSGGANSAANNLFWNIGAQPRTSGLAESGSIVADPLMVNFRRDGTGDYHLTAGSPAVDRGTSVIAPLTDFDGKRRPSGAGYEIGPFEFWQRAN